MNLSIIIVSWNVKEKLKENLRALFKSKYADFEVIVVDNNSHDGTAAMVKSDFPQVKLIANSENLGFAKANNQAIRQFAGRAKYILLLNPDMRVFEDTLLNMISWMDNNKQAAVAGCKLLDEKGGLVRHVRRFPGLLDQLAVVLKITHFVPGILNKYLRADYDYNKSARVDSIRGGFFMIREETIKKIGLLDERYFLWFEEVDYCRRVRQNGMEVWYAQSAECIDLVGQSFKQVNLTQKQKYFRDSMLKYFKKWHSPLAYWILKLAWPIGIMIAQLAEKARIKSQAKT